MFNPFKKNKSTMDLEDVLGEFRLYDKPFVAFIQDKQQKADVLDLTLTLPKNADQTQLETLYYQLCTKLQDVGIQEVNLNVILSDKPKSQPSTSKQASKSNDAQMFIPSSDKSPKEPTKTTPLQKNIEAHPRIRHIIVIASGKGGVGKSTTTVNLALALQKIGKRVGILDADIYGPSMPDMLGVAGIKPQVENDQFVPIDAHGIAMLSIGSLLDGDSTPVAWRGIKATGALMQLYQQTNWPMLDYLVIDMPPGTGDIQLTLAQRIPITGAVIVTTPQHIALLDAKKGIEMFGKTQIPVIGIVENMALHTCSACGHTEAIFGSGGGEQMMKTYGVPLLGQLPLASAIREQVDKGMPSVLADDGFGSHYLDIAKKIDESIGQFAKVRTDGRIF